MKALVLGLGISGKSALSLLERRGVEVVAVDDGFKPHQSVDLSDIDLFVPSPGIPPSHPIYQDALKRGIPIQGEVELFLQQTDQFCIGITGTNGKTTTALMINHLLNASGKKAVCAGNVGFPLANVDKKAICVLELSSFQLETLCSKKLDIGVILNITPDHLDRYASFEAYRDAKISIQERIKSEGKLFVHESLDPSLFSRPIERFGEGVAKVIGKIFGLKDFSLLETFQRPPHRLEFVETIEGISYINDSKATNVAATLHAISEVREEMVLILGGKDKGLSFLPVRDRLAKGHSVIVYGEAREKIANQLQPLSEVHVVETLEQAVDLATYLAKSGDVVLFSPGCASFDAFKNYEKRGEAFKDYVRRRMK